MTDIGEAVQESNDNFGKNKCPFCNKDEHPWPEKKPIDISKIKSTPSTLKCDDLDPEQKQVNTVEPDIT